MLYTAVLTEGDRGAPKRNLNIRGVFNSIFYSIVGKPGRKNNTRAIGVGLYRLHIALTCLQFGLYSKLDLYRSFPLSCLTLIFYFSYPDRMISSLLYC